MVHQTARPLNPLPQLSSWVLLALLLEGAPGVQDEWEADIPGAAVREGAEVVLDCKPQHTMSWPSVDDFWEVPGGRGADPAREGSWDGLG